MILWALNGLIRYYIIIGPAALYQYSSLSVDFKSFQTKSNQAGSTNLFRGVGGRLILLVLSYMGCGWSQGVGAHLKYFRPFFSSQVIKSLFDRCNIGKVFHGMGWSISTFSHNYEMHVTYRKHKKDNTPIQILFVL